MPTGSLTVNPWLSQIFEARLTNATYDCAIFFDHGFDDLVLFVSV